LPVFPETFDGELNILHRIQKPLRFRGPTFSNRGEICELPKGPNWRLFMRFVTYRRKLPSGPYFVNFFMERLRRKCSPNLDLPAQTISGQPERLLSSEIAPYRHLSKLHTSALFPELFLTFRPFPHTDSPCFSQNPQYCRAWNEQAGFAWHAVVPSVGRVCRDRWPVR
jgi:hypothetical protein